MVKHKSSARPESPSRITRAELVAEVRGHRIRGPRPSTSLKRVHAQLSAALDTLLENLDYYGNLASEPALFARCLAAILGDIEDMGAVD